MGNKRINSDKKEVAQYLELFYMTPCDVQAKDIASLFKENMGSVVELWDSMNVLELVLPNQSSVDFEPVDVNFKDASDLAFVKNRKIRTIFAINLNANDLNIVLPYFEQLVNLHSGFVCADSPDFTPVYAGSAKK